MALLDFNRDTSLNVIPKEDFQDLILSTFNSISKVMANSLGPLGSTTTILDGMYTSATKDGWTIFKHLRPGNIYRAMVYNLIHGPCSKLNNTVGDGTTTAIELTSLIFQAYRERQTQLEKLYRLPREFNKVWDETIAEICDRVKTYARALPVDSVYDVAYVASNGNHEIAENMQEIYNKSAMPIVKLRSSPTNACYVDAVRGYEFPADLTDDAYVRNDDMSGTYENIRVLLFDVKVERDVFDKIIAPLNDIYRAKGITLLVIAPAYDELLAGTVMKAYANHEWKINDGRLNLIVSQFRYDKLKKHQLEDLAVLLNTQIIDRFNAETLIKAMEEQDEDLFDQIDAFEDDPAMTMEPFDYRRMIGIAPMVRLTVGAGSIFTNFDTDNNERYQGAMKKAITARDDVMARTDADKKNFSIEVSQANAHIAQLQMETYMYYVGANSSLQISVLETAVDDVIKAVRSAATYGIVPGCQLSIITACESLRTELPPSQTLSCQLKDAILGVILSATCALYNTVLAGPEKTGVTDAEFNEIIQDSIANFTVYDLETSEQSKDLVTSVETDLNVLMAASELIKLLISGNQCVYLDSTLTNSEIINP